MCICSITVWFLYIKIIKLQCSLVFLLALALAHLFEYFSAKAKL